MASVLITGANRGIGLEYLRQYCQQGWTVHACARDLSTAHDLLAIAEQAPSMSLHQLDVRNAGQVQALAASLEGQPIDVLINNAGVYGPKGLGLEQLNTAEWLRVVEVNSLAPILLAKALLANVQRSKQKKMVFMSSKMGSITDNGSGGSYLYRSSKAALNAATKSLAIDLASQGVCVLTLHPGWVKTDMGGPNALISPQESVAGLRAVIADATPAASGGFYNYDGTRIPW